MLCDSLTHGARYLFGPVWQHVFHELMALVAQGEALPEGRYSLAGGLEKGGAEATVSVYDSRLEAQARYETHDIMTDIQLVLDGEEEVLIVERQGLSPATDYDTVKDITFYQETPTPLARVHLKPGRFLFVAPHDAHMPSLAISSPARVKKLVVKLPLAQLEFGQK